MTGNGPAGGPKCTLVKFWVACYNYSIIITKEMYYDKEPV